MDIILELITNFNLPNLICMVAVMWYFTRDLKNSVDDLHKDMNRLNERISRLEGTIYGKDYYHYSSTNKDNK